MKYGLRNDDSKKFKWRISVDQDIANLKMEVRSLKQQLKNSLDLISLIFSKESADASVKGLKDVTPGTMFPNFSPTRVYDPYTLKYGYIHCFTTEDKSLEELRLEDCVLKSTRFFNQIAPIRSGFTQVVRNPVDRLPVYDDTRSKMQEDEPLSLITSHLGKINDKMTLLTSQLSTMDINISEISSQMSVMDSRLSAVDMFVTMQQVEKRWQELASRLQSIENNPENSKLSNGSKTNDPLYSIKEFELPTQEHNKNIYYSPQDIFLLNNSIGKHCNSPQDITTKDSTLMSNSSNFENNLGIESAEIEKSDHLNFNSNAVVSFVKANLEEDNLSNKSLSPTPLDDKTDKLKLKNLPNPVQNNSKMNVCKSGSNMAQQTSNPPASSKSGSEAFDNSKEFAGPVPGTLAPCAQFSFAPPYNVSPTPLDYKLEKSKLQNLANPVQNNSKMNVCKSGSNMPQQTSSPSASSKSGSEAFDNSKEFAGPVPGTLVPCAQFSFAPPNNVSPTPLDYKLEKSKLQNLPNPLQNNFKMNVRKSESNKPQQTSSPPASSKSGSEAFDNSKEFVTFTTDNSQESILDKGIKIQQFGENLRDIENEFVLIDKLDIDVLHDQRSEEANSSISSNTTEFIEVNLRYLNDGQNENTEETVLDSRYLKFKI